MITEQEIQKFEAFISKLPLEHNRSSNEFGYDNPVLLCLDAVLSMNRKYDSFVVPRIHLFVESYPEINRLEKLHDLIQRLGHDGFCEAWNYKHVERVQILERLCTRLMEITQTQNAPTEIAALKQWARSARPHDYQEFGVKGIGLATFQYIRMMLGAEFLVIMWSG